jgi:hypothetical protein
LDIKFLYFLLLTKLAKLMIRIFFVIKTVLIIDEQSLEK